MLRGSLNSRKSVHYTCLNYSRPFEWWSIHMKQLQFNQTFNEIPVWAKLKLNRWKLHLWDFTSEFHSKLLESQSHFFEIHVNSPKRICFKILCENFISRSCIVCTSKASVPSSVSSTRTFNIFLHNFHAHEKLSESLIFVWVIRTLVNTYIVR